MWLYSVINTFMIYYLLLGPVSCSIIKPTDDLIQKNRHHRNQHSMAFQIPSATKEAYKCSFFPQTIRDWNDLPDSLITCAEMSDDCVSKFASLVRASV